MVKLNAYDMVTGHVQTIHTWVKGHRAWSHAYRMLTRQPVNGTTTYYLSEV